MTIKYSYVKAKRSATICRDRFELKPMHFTEGKFYRARDYKSLFVVIDDKGETAHFCKENFNLVGRHDLFEIAPLSVLIPDHKDRADFLESEVNEIRGIAESISSTLMKL